MSLSGGCMDAFLSGQHTEARCLPLGCNATVSRDGREKRRRKDAAMGSLEKVPR
jgi:hypothetical protein